ncbi:MAG: septum formation initiator family protein [Candidatus Doudnabacteria bacterium]|nr:septum formation initiator family protein [Candidatus Doudnabacteria bacterium]
MEIKSILKSKLASVGLMILLALILVMSSKLFMQKREVQKEIKTLQEKADSISKDNAELSELIKYYKTDEYAQRAARDKLNLKKEGEFAVSLPPSVTSEAPDSKKEEKSNPKKWYDYFF